MIFPYLQKYQILLKKWKYINDNLSFLLIKYLNFSYIILIKFFFLPSSKISEEKELPSLLIFVLAFIAFINFKV